MRTNLIIAGLMMFALTVPIGMAVAVEQNKQEAAPKGPVAVEPDDGKKSNILYEYGSMSRRDPFTSLIQKKSGKEKGATPLQSYSSDEMKVIAIMWSKNKYYAVISLPDKKSYTVFEGVKVGNSSGVIKKIGKDQLIIAEKVRDARGRTNPRDRVLKLRTEEE
jgi:Tfp pilus assembly protein PilP